MFPLLMEGRRVAIDLTDCMDRSIKGRRVVIAFMIQPIARAMRLEIGFFLKQQSAKQLIVIKIPAL